MILLAVVIVCLCLFESLNIDVWQTLADLFNKLADVDISSVESHAECPAEGIVIVLCGTQTIDSQEVHFISSLPCGVRQLLNIYYTGGRLTKIVPVL